ncbi:hypothetical protein BC835DRAFT_1515722 [Cytidiella melzeri]|nr:hypothetical protein BC835DRAFT_1515722 [Cytidiella melzeri]
MSKVSLSSIKSLTFYQDGLTTARRTDPISQLNCLGEACSLYTPEAVRCTNIGGHGTEIDWKCEADLPEALRFGRVEVSCEGWSGPGDPFVVKGSCALNYRLVQVPVALRRTVEQHGVPSHLGRWFQSYDVGGLIFMTLWVAVVLYIAYKVLKSCFLGPPYTAGTSGRPGAPGGGSHSFPGTYGDDHRTDPPPPYSKYSSTGGTQGAPRDWQPVFLAGAAAGGIGTYFMNRHRRQDTPVQQLYDWEQPRGQRQPWSSYTSPRRAFSNDRGEGSSSGLGSMRSSTGLGGSSVR